MAEQAQASQAHKANFRLNDSAGGCKVDWLPACRRLSHKCRWSRDKNQRAKQVQPLGVVMRARSPLLSMKLPSSKDKAKAYAAQSDRIRASTLAVSSAFLKH